MDALTGDPKPIHLQLLALYLDRHQMVVEQIAKLDGMIAEAMEPHQEAVARLAAVPGFGPDSAQQVIAEVGPQASTFPSAADLTGWVGTCPGQDESAEENHSSRSAKGNKYLRRILNQAAHAAVKKKGSHFQAVFRRLLPRLGYNGAIWAVAHRLCRLVWKILHDGVAYVEQGSEPDPRAKRRRAQRLLKTLRKLGYEVEIKPITPCPSTSLTVRETSLAGVIFERAIEGMEEQNLTRRRSICYISDVRWAFKGDTRRERCRGQVAWMKSAKITKRKKFGIVAGDGRRTTRRRAASQTTAKRRLSSTQTQKRGLRFGSGNGRPAHNTGGSVPGKASQGLDLTPRRPTAEGNGNGAHVAAVKQFEVALRHFRKENYNKAKEILESLAGTAPPEVADRARVYLRLCERRSSTASAPKTAADNYLFGITELNAGRLDSAEHYLEKAHKLEPKRDDVCYALAACYASQAKAAAALELLKLAIDLRPQNRSQARLDPDFRSLAGDPRFVELVHARFASPLTHDG
jgi:tetratricopeptide (TPR) repeat protein